VSKFIHPLGKQAKDKIIGFQGILIGRTEYLFGCNVYGIAPQVFDKEKGKRGETEWFDEGRIEVIGPGILPKAVQAQDPGAEYHDCAPGR
jgi:hypothetical protein